MVKASNKRRRTTPATQKLTSSPDDSGDDERSSKQSSPKRSKLSNAATATNVNRRLRLDLAFGEAGDEDFAFVHAADIANLGLTAKYLPAFDGSLEDLKLFLLYPGASTKEGYVFLFHMYDVYLLDFLTYPCSFELVRPRDTDDFKPLQDIIDVAELVPKFYLTNDQAKRFLDDAKGIHRKLKRAIANKSYQEFREAVAEYNEALEGLRAKGVITKNLDDIHELPLPLVEHILTQIYSRTVSPKVDSLRKYENGTDNVYGELLPRFISKIFKETKITSDKVFVDLGSGVGNVVLQAALEIGCESWGCEVMENACDLAELQQAEFKARCRLWGLSTGDVHLERGDFLVNPKIAEILKKADVVLVNNQAFTPELNDHLVSLFLDLKEGCQIVSLRSFVPHDHKITKRNLNSPINLLEVESKTYYSNCVSWTNAPGTYFKATKDSRKLKEFTKKNGLIPKKKVVKK